MRGTSGGDWFGVPPSGGSFAVPFTNVTWFKDDQMQGESIYFDLATLCVQAGASVGCHPGSGKVATSVEDGLREDMYPVCNPRYNAHR